MDVDITKERVSKIYKYLEALCQHRNPVKRQISEQSWVLWLDNLTNHPAIKFSGNSYSEEARSYILKLKRPKITSAPEPPAELEQWLKNGWQEPCKAVEVLDAINIHSNGEVITILFADNIERVELLTAWSCRRDLWSKAECPAREVMKLYERVYDLYALMQKESEKYRIVLGDGILNWRRPEGGIHHPILLQRIELEFDATNAEFSFEETDEPSELYGALFASLEDVDGTALAYNRSDMETNNYSPLGGEITDSFLKRFISQLSVHGEFMPDGDIIGELDSPRIFRKPCIFIQDRSAGLLVSIQGILEDLQENTDLPGSLQSIVGVGQDDLGEIAKGSGARYLEAKEIYFGKPANLEQIKVAEVLDNNFGVLVQGPPGTGKTHTIANLLGHLLTQGKTVLVTSHTTKALRVLRDKVAKELQPLCVSVLDRDSQSQEELKKSIESIVSQLSTINENDYQRKNDEFQSRREWILQRINELQQNLIECRSSEFQNIVIAGKEYQPRVAIETVLTGRNVHDWIPGQIAVDSPLPLAVEDFNTLYQYTYKLSTENLAMSSCELPSLEGLPAQDLVTSWMEEEGETLALDYITGEEYWNDTLQDSLDANYLILEEVLKNISLGINEIDGAPDWHIAILQAGYKGNAHRQVWDSLVSDAEYYLNKHAIFKTEIYKYQPAFLIKSELYKDLAIVNEIINHLEDGGTLGRLTLLLHSSWGKFRKSITVNNKILDTLTEFIFIRDYLALQLTELELIQRWNCCMQECNGLILEPDSNITELIPQIYPIILQKLNWYDSVWKQQEEKLISIGFSWNIFISKQPIITGHSGEFIRLFQTICGPLQESLLARLKKYRLAEVQQSLGGVTEYVNTYCQKDYSDIAIAIRAALRSRNIVDYNLGITNLRHAISVREMVAKREVLLEKLTVYAPEWSKQIEKFSLEQVSPNLPSNVEEAWLWKQLNQELLNRSSISMDKIQAELELQKADLYAITNQLISGRAWLHQKRRVKLNQQQALVGYLDIMKRIGRGTGKRVPEFLKEARRLMSECRSAVPVWIMPLTRVAETFSPKQMKFDVVIIDEASQCDLMGLIAMYLAKKVVVVGDHEQVSPLSVGQNSNIITNLISQFLQGIPNSILYDGKASIYDLARQSFGGVLCLTEHFRCVPEIIQFSNKLCYNMELKPLRESNTSHLKPAVVPYRVMGAARDGKTNEQEAITIASLVVAACQLPIYKDKTMGVISLLGDDQAMVIERELRKHLTDEEYRARRIICGNSAHFQGDERDIIFLSLVDATDNPPLALRTDGPDGMYKKRYNVAASRACDQMWVVHSLDAKTDVKPGDIRRELIEHAENPFRYDTEFEQLADQTESPFEKEVLKGLVDNGYKVVPQWKVGYYRIDMVAICGDKKVAIECDGEQFHALDKLAEDMARQAVLERLGWRFIRIRGSQYYLNREKTMELVYARLNELDVYPGLVDEEDNLLQESEIVQQVIRDADLLRITWRGEKGQLNTPSIELTENAMTSIVIDVTNNVQEVVSSTEITVDNLTIPQNNDVQWVIMQGAEKWQQLAKWGKENKKLNEKYFLSAQRLSNSVLMKTEITPYQAAKGRQMMGKLIIEGF